jgi:hypothetical protein
MDPFLEDSGFWPDFHESFLTYAREDLQPLLPPQYYAALQTREELGIIGGEAERVFLPDVAVRELPGASRRTKRLPATGKASQPEHLVIALAEPLRVSFLEIREAAEGDRLVTLIELLSPANKQPGPDREAFEQKQRETLESDVNWVEIDLLRKGQRIACHPSVNAYTKQRKYSYLVTVSRSTRRGPKLDLELYGFTASDSFPVVLLPLRPKDTDISLDLGKVFRRAYETGPYRKLLQRKKRRP